MTIRLPSFEKRMNALIAIAVPTVALGLAVTSASAYNPKAIRHDLFFGPAFRTQVRDARRFDDPIAATGSTQSLRPSAPPHETGALTLEDLSDSQLQTLRRQLRTGGCPQDALTAYRDLCESMLKYRLRPETREGLKNPIQP